MTEKKPPTPPPATDAAPGGRVVRVGLDTVVLTDSEADALAFDMLGHVPDDRREVAGAARDKVRGIVTEAVAFAIDPAVAVYREHLRTVALSEARARAEVAAREVELLESQAGGEVNP